jgi:hypothetical protein
MQLPPPKSQTLHVSQEATLASMSEIEAKINSKLQEIEGLFEKNSNPGLAPPVIIKNTQSQSQLEQTLESNTP